MSERNPVEVEYGRLLSRLLELMRLIRQAPMNALARSSARGELAKLPDMWSEAGAIGLSLMELGGLAMMHSAVREVRRFSAGMCDALEGSWEGRVPGYKKIQWLP